MCELIFQPTPVADGESKKKECNQKVISWAFYKTFEWWVVRYTIHLMQCDKHQTPKENLILLNVPLEKQFY